MSEQMQDFDADAIVAEMEATGPSWVDAPLSDAQIARLNQPVFVRAMGGKRFDEFKTEQEAAEGHAMGDQAVFQLVIDRVREDTRRRQAQQQQTAALAEVTQATAQQERGIDHRVRVITAALDDGIEVDEDVFDAVVEAARALLRDAKLAGISEVLTRAKASELVSRLNRLGKALGISEDALRVGGETAENLSATETSEATEGAGEF